MFISRFASMQVAYDPGNKSKPIAIRIKKLPKGSLKQDQVVSSFTYTGTVVQDQPGRAKKPGIGSTAADTGLIRYQANGNGNELTISYLVLVSVTILYYVCCILYYVCCILYYVCCILYCVCCVFLLSPYFTCLSLTSSLSLCLIELN